MNHVHSDRLERWLGKSEVERISCAMRDWYGPRGIAIGNVPGCVYAMKGGAGAAFLPHGFYGT